jgi:hypothetical protein
MRQKLCKNVFINDQHCTLGCPPFPRGEALNERQFNFFTAPQFRGEALVATASAFLAVGFSRPSAQAHDELKSLHRGYQCAIVP